MDSKNDLVAWAVCDDCSSFQKAGLLILHMCSVCLVLMGQAGSPCSQQLAPDQLMSCIIGPETVQNCLHAAAILMANTAVFYSHLHLSSSINLEANINLNTPCGLACAIGTQSVRTVPGCAVGSDWPKG